MTSINIRRDVNDSFYRYKMPKLQAKIEGKGNGIKTVVTNLSDIAKALNRNPMYILKYFGNELGAQVKESKDERYIVNGAHDAEKLQETLDGFIQKFLLCLECKNPETFLIVEKNGDIWRECKACGKKTLVDMKHKLCSFIAKNPPVQQNNYKKEQSKAEEDEDSEVDEDEAENEEVEEEIIDAPVAIKSQLDDWSSLQELSLEDQLERIAQFIEKNENVSNDQIMEKITQSNCARYDKVVAVLVQVLFTKDINKQLVSRKPLFLKLYKKSADAEKCMKAFLGGLERLVGMTVPDLLPKVPTILHKVYELELVDEEVFLEWAEGKKKNKYVDKKIAKEVRVKAKPFINWLEEAEEESEEDDEE